MYLVPEVKLDGCHTSSKNICSSLERVSHKTTKTTFEVAKKCAETSIPLLKQWRKTSGKGFKRKI